MPRLEIDDVDFIAEAAFQAQHKAIAAHIDGNHTRAGRKRELRRRRIPARRAVSAKAHRKSHDQHAKRDDDQDTQQDDGGEQEGIGWSAFNGSGQRRHAGFGF